jgi:hypothetical protein
MGAKLTIGMWEGEVRSGIAEDKVSSDFDIARSKSKTTIKLCTHGGFKDAALAAGRMIRTTHYDITSPWEDRGARVFKTSGFTFYRERISKCIDSFHEAREKFFEHYEETVLEDKIILKSLVPSWYPSPDKLKGMFYSTIRFVPILRGADFRLDVPEEELERIKADVDSENADKVKVAMTDLHSRILKPIQLLVDKLDNYGDGKRMHDTILTNLRDVVEVLPNLNFTNDPVVQILIDKIANDLLPPKGEETSTVEQLRNDASLRRHYSEKARGILGI